MEIPETISVLLYLIEIPAPVLHDNIVVISLFNAVLFAVVDTHAIDPIHCSTLVKINRKKKKKKITQPQVY